jgi:hypothetical protein
MSTFYQTSRDKTPERLYHSNHSQHESRSGYRIVASAAFIAFGKEDCNAVRMFLASLGNKIAGFFRSCFNVIKLPSSHYNVSIPNPHSGLKLLYPSIDDLQYKSQCQKQ